VRGLNVLLDSSFILSSVQLRLDALAMLEDSLDTKLEPLVLAETLRELKKISSTGGKRGREAEMALRIAEKYPAFSCTEKTASVDEAIVQVAGTLRCIVATNDVKLKRRLRSSGIAVAFVHRDKRVEVEGWAGLH